MQTQVTINKPNQKDYLKIEELNPGSWYVIKDYRHNQGLVGKIGICASVRNQETFDCRNAFIDMNGDDLDHRDLRFEMLEKSALRLNNPTFDSRLDFGHNTSIDSTGETNATTREADPGGVGGWACAVRLPC